jgi:hypothetical protein
MMDQRFTALRVIGTIFKILAWISLVLGLLAAVAMLVLGFLLGGEQATLGLNLGGPLAGIAMFVVLAISAVIGFLTLYAVGESVYVFLSIEENTRRSAYIAQQQYTSYPVTYPQPPQTEPEGDD